jgi:hypothetical protein
MVIDVDIDQ